MANQDIFTTKVVPIMNKVREDLCAKRAKEYRDYTTSASGILSTLADPYGVHNPMDTLSVTGKWNSKTVEDYVDMVKKELKKKGITVTKDMEKKMIDKMVKDKIPKSSIDYIISKAATQTIFYIPTAIKTSPLQAEIEGKAEKAYNPKAWEKGTAYGLSVATDVATTGGLGGGWGTAAKIAVTDVALDAVADKVIPMVIAPGKEQEYLNDQAKQKQQKSEKKKEETKPEEKPTEETQSEDTQSTETNSDQQEQTSGWDELVRTLGFEGLKDVGNNLGYILAMLPDMIVGLFTGKTESVNLKEDIVPIASLVGGMFVKNPLLKTMLMGYGGVNLLNKMGHEALDRENTPVVDTQRGYATGKDGRNYKIYQDEQLNPRATNPVISGNRLICSIDGVPCNIPLTNSIVQAYNSGSLPINTLVNAILKKNDKVEQVQQTEKYEQPQTQTVSRSRGV